MSQIERPIPLERLKTSTRSLIEEPLRSSTTTGRSSSNGNIQFTNPSLPDQIDIGKPIMTLKTPHRNVYRVLATYGWGLAAGMTDGVIGSLLPFIEKHYDVNYAVVSTLWLGTAIGFIVVGLFGHLIDAKLGKCKSLLLGTTCHIIMCIILCTGTVFPVIVIGMFFGGLGMAINLGLMNTFLPSVGAQYLTIFNGFYGIGACTGPLIGTLMTDRGIRWNYFYFVLLGISVFDFCSMGLTFKGLDQDLEEYTVEFDKDEEDNTNSSGQKREHDFMAAFKDYRSWLGCIFVSFYQGSEVSLGGWVVTFILTYRKGNPSSVGYVSSGFWAGVTVGRFLLTTILINKLGSRRSILILIALIVPFDILTWLIPETIAAAVFASMAGVFIGPIYTLMMVWISKNLPRKIRLVSIVLMCAFGSSGGSAVPFMVGMLSQIKGTFVLHPIFLGCYAMMFMAWVSLPNTERKGAIKTFWQRFW